MKVCAFGLSSLPCGIHNIKDPRLDETHKLVEAKKKAYAQVDVVGNDDLVDADCVVTNEDGVEELRDQDVSVEILHNVSRESILVALTPPTTARASASADSLYSTGSSRLLADIICI